MFFSQPTNAYFSFNVATTDTDIENETEVDEVQGFLFGKLK